MPLDDIWQTSYIYIFLVGKGLLKGYKIDYFLLKLFRAEIFIWKKKLRILRNDG